MSTISSHHHFRWLNLLTRHLATFAGNSAPAELPDTDGQSRATDLGPATATVAQGSTSVQVEAPAQAVAPTMNQVEAADPATKTSSAETQAAHVRLTRDTHLSAQEQYSGQSGVEHGQRNRMRCKKVRLVINPRAGHNFTRISDVLAVFSAAGWETDLAVKLHAGHAMELAAQAAEEGFDLVIAYGGDGTINQVVNGVMASNGKGQPGIVGVLPGGTANQWVTETSEPIDPIKAALSLIDSDVGAVDLGRIQVQELKFPNANQEGPKQQQKGRKKVQKSKAKPPARVETYFLLTAGLGIDAEVISHTSKTMKQRVGRLAFDLAAAEVLPEKHAFPLEIAAIEANGRDATVLWSGEAFQIILGNTRRYADVVEMTPDAYLDDGKLDLCVIEEDNTLATLEQMLSFLFRRRPDSKTCRNFQGTHFLLTVPASIHLQLDGSSVQLEDYLSKADCKALRQAPDRAQVMVSYRYDAVPHALRVALPETYDNTLFEHSRGDPRGRPGNNSQIDEQQPGVGARFIAPEPHDGQREEIQREASDDLVNVLLEDGYKVTITGVVMATAKRQRYVMAGHAVRWQTGETMPVAIRIDEDATVLLRTGEHVPSGDVLKVQAGAEVIVVGKKNKRGVIKAKHVMLLST
jgi:YegS/Rv2252/BmrU family lipid kinase